MRTFIAHVLSAEELTDLNTFAVVLAEAPDGTGHRLELQRSLSFDEQDRRSGQNTYCVSTEEGATHYGGVTSWALDADRLELTLDAEAEAALGVNRGFLVELPRGSTAALEAGLARVFAPDAG